MAWRWPLQYLAHCRASLGSCFTLSTTGHPPLVFLSEERDVRAMLSAPPDVLHPGEGGSAVSPIVGDQSFMVLDGDEHLRGRRLVSRPFDRRHGIEHQALAVQVAERAIASWPRGRPVAMLPLLRALTLEVILRVAISPDSDAQLRWVRDRVLAMMDFNASPTLTEAALRYAPIGRRQWRRFLAARSEVDRIIGDLIIARRRSGEHRDDVLGLLVGARDEDGAPLPAQRIRDDLMSVILAGHETTASQLAWTFQLLAHHPAPADRVLDEREGADPYLRAVVLESLRHRPVFLFTIPRAVVAPFEVGGWAFETGAHLLGCIYLMHHDPACVAEPDRFIPERFLATPPDPAAWLPWGGGRKTCPGRHLALIEMQTVLRVALTRLRVAPAADRMERARWRGVIVTPHRGGEVILREHRGRGCV